jgi:hypothetical protein
MIPDDYPPGYPYEEGKNDPEMERINNASKVNTLNVSFCNWLSYGHEPLFRRLKRRYLESWSLSGRSVKRLERHLI